MSDKPNPLLLGALVVGVGFAGWSLASGAPADPVQREPEPPPLFDEPGPCEHPRERAAHAADLAERDALIKMDRAPFFPSDGVRAVHAAQRAGACYAAAGDERAAARLDARIAEWRDALTRQYGARRVRLALAERRGDAAGALDEVRALRALLSHRDGPYVDRLRRRERKLDREATP